MYRKSSVEIFILILGDGNQQNKRLNRMRKRPDSLPVLQSANLNEFQLKVDQGKVRH